MGNHRRTFAVPDGCTDPARMRKRGPGLGGAPLSRRRAAVCSLRQAEHFSRLRTSTSKAPKRTPGTSTPSTSSAVVTAGRSAITSAASASLTALGRARLRCVRCFAREVLGGDSWEADQDVCDVVLGGVAGGPGQGQVSVRSGTARPIDVLAHRQVESAAKIDKRPSWLDGQNGPHSPHPHLTGARRARWSPAGRRPGGRRPRRPARRRQ